MIENKLVPQIDGRSIEFLENILSGEDKEIYPLNKYKFILDEGPSGEGYIRIDLAHQEHSAIYNWLLKIAEIKRQTNLTNRGGGWLYKAEEEIRQGRVIPARIIFTSGSEILGPFIPELLHATLQKNLREDFPYEIPGYYLRIK